MDLARAKHLKTTRNERHDATWRRLWVRQHSRPSRDWSTSIVSCFVSTLLSLSLSFSLLGSISSNVYRRLPTELRCIYRTARDYVSGRLRCLGLPADAACCIVYFLTSICGSIFYRVAHACRIFGAKYKSSISFLLGTRAFSLSSTL